MDIETPTTRGGGPREVVLTFLQKKGQGEPAKLEFSARREVVIDAPLHAERRAAAMRSILLNSINRYTLAVVLLLAATVGLLQSIRSPWGYPNARCFDRIQVGMTQSEVENLLGGAPGHYGRQGGPPSFIFSGIDIPPGTVRCEVWSSDYSAFHVQFDQDDRVVGSFQKGGFSGLWGR